MYTSKMQYKSYYVISGVRVHTAYNMHPVVNDMITLRAGGCKIATYCYRACTSRARKRGGGQLGAGSPYSPC